MPADQRAAGRGWRAAGNLSWRCTMVTDAAIGSSIRTESTAESPPPTTTTPRPRQSPGSGTLVGQPATTVLAVDRQRTRRGGAHPGDQDSPAVQVTPLAVATTKPSPVFCRDTA